MDGKGRKGKKKVKESFVVAGLRNISNQRLGGSVVADSALWGNGGKKKKLLSGKDATAQLFLGSDFFPGAGPAASSRMGEGGPHPSRAIMYTVAPKTNDWSRESGYATAVNSRNFRVTGLL